jgi:hypothetical protein
MRTLLVSISAMRPNQRDVWYDKLISGFVFNFPDCESGSIGSRRARTRRAPRLRFVTADPHAAIVIVRAAVPFAARYCL